LKYKEWSYVHMRPIENVWLPGDEELFAPVVNRPRRVPHDGYYSAPRNSYSIIDMDALDALVARYWGEHNDNRSQGSE
jgi:hypothetical protein